MIKLLKQNIQGFTITEVLMVVSIIAILCLLVTPHVLDTFAGSQTTLSKELETSIISSTKLYLEEHKQTLNLDCHHSTYDLPFKALYDGGYLNSVITDIKTKESIDLSHNYVRITYDCDKDKYSYQIINNYE